MGRCLRLAVLVASALLGGATVAAADAGPGIAGTWRGVLTQRGLPAFTVTATIRSRDAAAGNTVLYSGLGCRGKWSFRGRDGNVYRFLETITAGRSKTCKGTGTVTLRPLPGGKLAYVFRGGGVESRGTLTRIRRSS